MKKINIYALALMMISTLVFTSCEEQENIVFDGTQYTLSANFSAGNLAIPVKEDEKSSVDLIIEVTTASDSDRTVSVEVDASSTATSDQYTITNIVIPAGEYVGQGEVTGIYDQVPLSGSVDLVLKIASIEGASTFSPGSNETLTISLERFCPSDLAGTWQYQNGRTKVVTITELSEGNYRVSGGNAFGTDYPFSINDRCNAITIFDPFIESNFGIATSGSGEVLANGDISLVYTVDGFFTDRSMILRKQ